MYISMGLVCLVYVVGKIATEILRIMKTPNK